MKENNSLSYLIILTILLFAGIYYRSESKKRLYKGDIISKEVTVSEFKPMLLDYESTDDIKFEFSEFPDKVFEIDYLLIDFDKGKELLTNLHINDKIIIDVDRQHYNKKISKNTFLGIKHSISILGIRMSEQDEIPVLNYNVEVVSKNLTISYVSFFGALLIVLFWIYEYVKRKTKVKNTTANKV
jgi:hypothetical protein